MKTKSETVEELIKDMAIDIKKVQALSKQDQRKIIFQIQDEFKRRNKNAFCSTATIKRVLRLWV